MPAETFLKPSQRHKRENQIDIAQWLFDKDKRGTLAWISTLIGGFFVVGYYFTLGIGFAPTINIGQATLLLFQAFVVGTFITGVFCVGLFAPMFSFRLVGINVDLLFGETTRKAIPALLKRNITGQLWIVSLVFFAGSCPIGRDNGDPIVWAVSSEVLLFSTLALFFLPKLTEFNFTETRAQYLGSLIAIIGFGLFSYFFIWAIYEQAPLGSRAKDWEVFLAWAIVCLYSGIIGTIRRTDLLPGSAIVILLFFLIQGFLNSPAMLFRLTAYSIGIAERNPVTIVLPPATCPIVRNIIPGAILNCEGVRSGILESVRLLNSLGERWVMQVTESSEPIIFDGRGVVVQKEISKKRTQ